MAFAVGGINWAADEIRVSDADEMAPFNAPKKYYSQRRRLFTKFDEGIQMTETSWFEVTPESVATQTAKHIAEYAPPTKTILIDCFCGVGGNTIAFASSGRWTEVIGIDIDPEAIECAVNNAKVYGVQDKIRFINGDCFQVLQEQFSGMQEHLVIFASPPWGGPDYNKFQVFNLKAMRPYDMQRLYSGLSASSKELVLFLPRNSNLNQIAQYAEDGSQIQIVHYCIRSASKGIGAYLGGFERMDLSGKTGSEDNGSPLT